MTSEDHDMTLYYTSDDDGVWLDCSCGWRKNLGFNTSPEDAVAAADLHRTAPG